MQPDEMPPSRRFRIPVRHRRSKEIVSGEFPEAVVLAQSAFVHGLGGMVEAIRWKIHQHLGLPLRGLGGRVHSEDVNRTALRAQSSNRRQEHPSAVVVPIQNGQVHDGRLAALGSDGFLDGALKG